MIDTYINYINICKYFSTHNFCKNIYIINIYEISINLDVQIKI